MNILFVNYGDYSTASLNHIGVFANALCRQGHDCVVAIPSGLELCHLVAAPLFRAELYSSLLENPARFRDGRPADIVHGWTPRECIRKFITAYQARLVAPARVLLHLEDNEEHLATTFTGIPLGPLRELPETELTRLLPDNLPHPVRSRSFLQLADVVTHLSEPLRDLAPANAECFLLPPGLDPLYLQDTQVPETLRAELGVKPGEKVITFTGSNTFANDHEIRELYNAVLLLNRQGIPTRLLRTGIIPQGFLASFPAELAAQVTELGFVPKAQLPRLLALADLLVQPGRPGPFDDYRLPSKLPEYLASGKPVILPATNIAHKLRDGTEALFLSSGSAENIADCCRRLFQDPALAARLGAASAAFARSYFNPEHISERLGGLYASLLSRPAAPHWSLLADHALSDLSAQASVLSAGLARASAEAGKGKALTSLTELSEDLSLLIRSAERLSEVRRLRIAELETQLAETRQQLAHSQAEGARLAQELAQLGQQLSLLRDLHRELEGQYRIAVADRDLAHSQLVDLGAANRETNTQLQQAWAEHAKVSQRVAELDAELSRRDAKIRGMQSSLTWRWTAPLRKLGASFAPKPKG